MTVICPLIKAVVNYIKYVKKFMIGWLSWESRLTLAKLKKTELFLTLINYNQWWFKIEKRKKTRKFAWTSFLKDNDEV